MPHDFASELRLRSDRICNLILHSDLEWIDILIEIENLRDFCRGDADHQHDLELFEAIYAARFERLWEQWHLRGDTSWTWREA